MSVKPFASFLPEVKAWVLILVFLLALLLRLAGIYPGYPPDHPDEPILTVAFDMLKGRTLDPFVFGTYRFQYPGFLLYFYQILMAGIFVPVTLFVWFLRHPVAFLENLPRGDSLYFTLIDGVGGLNYLFWSRFITAFLGWLTVPLIYVVGKKLFNAYVGLAAAVIVAVNYRLIISSHLSLVDAPNATMALLSLFLTLQLWKKPTWKTYIAAAIGIGLSFATKFYFFSLPPFLLAHLLVSLREKTRRAMVISLVSPRFILSIVIIGFVFLVFNPFLPIHWEKAMIQQSTNNMRYGFGSNQLIMYPFWYLYEIGFGKLPVIFFFIGLAASLFQKRYWLSTLFLLLFIVPPIWMLTYFSHGGMYTRNFVSVIPFAAIFSALGLWEFLRLIIKGAKPESIRFLTVYLLGGAILVSTFQIRDSFIFDYFLSRPWNRDCYKNWIEQNILNGAKVAKTTGVPMVSADRISYVSNSNTLGHRTAFSLRELAETNTDFLAINYTESQIYFYSTVFSGISLQGLPKTILDNSFEGLALKELSRFTIFQCFKPWQSLESNLAVIKIPSKINPASLRKIYHSNQPIKINAQNSVALPERISLTPAIPIDEGKLYQVKVKLRTNQELPSEKRDGYIRLDFSPNNRTAISSRLFGSVNLQDKEIIEVAPSGTTSLQLSFQHDEGNTDFFIEAVTVSEASNLPSPELKQALTVAEVDDMVIYPQFIF